MLRIREPGSLVRAPAQEFPILIAAMPQPDVPGVLGEGLPRFAAFRDFDRKPTKVTQGSTTCEMPDCCGTSQHKKDALWASLWQMNRSMRRRHSATACSGEPK